MNRSRISTVTVKSVVTGLVAAAAILGNATNAKATSYFLDDSFNGQGSPSTAWSFYASNPSHSVLQVVSNNTYAQSAPNFLTMNLDNTTTSSDYDMAYRTFTSPDPSPVTSCSVFVETRAWFTETISIQMVNPNNWTYIAVNNINFNNPSCTNSVPATCYGHSNTVNTFACSNSIQVRLVVTGGSGGSRLGYLDSVRVTFNQ